MDERLVKRFQQLESDPDFKSLVTVLVYGSFKTASQAQRVVGIADSLVTSSQSPYATLLTCCRNLSQDSANFSATLDRYQQTGAKNLYQSPGVAANLTHLSEAIGYLGHVDWSGYLASSQSHAKLHAALVTLRQLVLGWLKVAHIFSQKLKG